MGADHVDLSAAMAAWPSPSAEVTGISNSISVAEHVVLDDSSVWVRNYIPSYQWVVQASLARSGCIADVGLDTAWGALLRSLEAIIAHVRHGGGGAHWSGRPSDGPEAVRGVWLASSLYQNATASAHGGPRKGASPSPIHETRPPRWCGFLAWRRGDDQRAHMADCHWDSLVRRDDDRLFT